MIHPEDQQRLDEAKAAMESAVGDEQAIAIKRYRILEDKAVRRALTDLDKILSTSPIKSANRMLTFRHIEDANFRIKADLEEAGQPCGSWQDL